MEKRIKITTQPLGEYNGVDYHMLLSDLKIYQIVEEAELSSNVVRTDVDIIATSVSGYISKEIAEEAFYMRKNHSKYPAKMLMIELLINAGATIGMIDEPCGTLITTSKAVVNNGKLFVIDVERLKYNASTKNNVRHEGLCFNVKEVSKPTNSELLFCSFCDIMELDFKLIERIHSIFQNNIDKALLCGLVKFGIENELENDKFLILLNIFAEYNLDLREYILDYSNKQIDVIVSAIKAGVDVTKLAYPYIPAEAMEIILTQLLAEKNARSMENPVKLN